MNPCVVIPIYDHGTTIAEVVSPLDGQGLHCIVVDDGSHRPTREALAALDERFDWVRIVRHESNRGRGAALRTAYRAALESGYSHAVQLDADGQHDTGDITRFVEAARKRPEALVLGSPVFDDSIPFHRRHGRKLSKGIVWLETGTTVVEDPLCGFRCVPLASTLEVLDRSRTGDRMDFDPELVIRLVRAGVPVVNLPTRVRYPEGGISHFRMVEDNARIAWRYVRLLFDFNSSRSAEPAGGRSTS